jgi:uncharacterized membrane protein YccF (DUF307 family)
VPLSRLGNRAGIRRRRFPDRGPQGTKTFDGWFSTTVCPELHVSPVSLLLNLLWIAFGGFWMALGWVVAAGVMVLTIIGLPWARAALTIASYTFLPFGRRVVDRPSSVVGGTFGLLGNFIWLVLAGWWLAVGHLITAAGLAITIIGIPFAWAHLKLAGVSLWPIGKDVVPISKSSAPLGRRTLVP